MKVVCSREDRFMTDGFEIQDDTLTKYTRRKTMVEVPEGVTTIGAGAFKGHVSMEEVVLPESISCIMKAAFKGCSKLRTINLPPNLTHLGQHAFHRCHSLRSVDVPTSVQRLSAGVFLLCDGLQRISMPGVVHLDRQVFSNNENLKWIELSKDLDVSCLVDVFTGCSQISEIRLSDNTVYRFDSLIEVISSTAKMHPIVKAIAEDICRMMESRDGVLHRFSINVKNLKIPYGIQRIGENCFQYKKGIATVVFPKTVTDIGSRAFCNCNSLERIVFAAEDVRVQRDSFKNCTSLNCVTTYDGRSFQLHGLSAADDDGAPPLVRMIRAQLLENFLISGTTLLRYRGSEDKVVVPDGITIIGEKAFSGNVSVGRVVLPDTVSEIRQEAFSDCLLLQTVNFPQGLKCIGKSAFEHCLKLIRADLPTSLTVIETAVFNRCKKLKEVVLGSKVGSIGDLAFFACHSLKTITLPTGLEYIGDMAFYKCFSLAHISLPNSLQTLGSNIFTAAGLKSAVIHGDVRTCGTDVFSQCAQLSKLTFEKGVTQISDKFAFQCPSLRDVELFDSIRQIGRGAFAGSLYEKTWIHNSTVFSIFIHGQRESGDVIIPEGITSIAGGAFDGNTAMTSISLPKSLEQIGARAFCGCTSLQQVTLPAGVRALAEGVFAHCSALEEVVSLGRIMQISDNAFYACSAISKVPSGDAVSIGKSAFFGCERLEEIQVHCTDIQTNVFGKTAFLQHRKERSPLVIVFDTVVDGRDCTGDVNIPEHVVNIAPYAFAGNEYITDATLPNRLKTIGEDAFGGCKQLRRIHFPSLLHVGKRAFEKCVSLSAVSGCVLDIDEGAFSFCTALKTVSLEQTRSLGDEAFCGCAALLDFQCDGLETIKDNCFGGCERLAAFCFSGIKWIGQRAFSDCQSLFKLSLGADTHIAAHAFENCGRVAEIELSHGGLQFGSYAFSGCTALRVIAVGVRKYTIENYFALFENSIPEIVKSIYGSVLSCFSIDDNDAIVEYGNNGVFVRIPTGIKAIAGKVFKDCMALEEVEIPRSVEYIGERAFFCTPWLERQKTDDPMVIINNILVDASACRGDIVIPSNVKIVSGWAFFNCFNLKSITFSSAETQVEVHAFRNCINVKRVVTADGKEYGLTGICDVCQAGLPANVQQLFADCYNCFKTDESQVLFECTGNIDELKLPKGITAIGDGVFNDSHLLTGIRLADETVDIGKNAFRKCKWLVSVTNAHHVRRVGGHAFSGCGSLKHIEFSEMLERLGKGAFEHCRSLKRIIIPEGITEIPEKAFFRCVSLQTVSLPSTLCKIGAKAFAFCDELSEINVPQSLTVVEKTAFAWCAKLNNALSAALVPHEI